MSFQNRTPFHDASRLPFQASTMSHQRNRMPHQHNRMPHQHNRMPHQHNRIQFQSINRYPPEENRYQLQADQKPPLVDNPLSFKGNQLPYQGHTNNLIIPSSFQDCTSNVRMSAPVNCFPPHLSSFPTFPFPPSDEKPNTNNKNVQHFHGTTFQENSRMACHGDIRLPFDNGSNSLPIQGNQRFPHQSIDAKGKLPLGGNSNQMFKDNIRYPKLPLPMNEGLIHQPKQISNSSAVIKNDTFRPSFPNHHISTPPVSLSNLPVRPIQVNAENQSIGPNYLHPSMHNSTVPNQRNLSVVPQPNLNVRKPPPINQIIQQIPVQNQIQNTQETQQNMNVPPPTPNEVVSNMRYMVPRPGLLVNLKHSFPPPPFVPGKEMNMLNNPVVTPQLFCPPSRNPDIVDKDLKTEYKETMVDIVKKWIKSRDSFVTLKSKDNQLMKIHKFKENLKVFVGLIEKLRHLNDSLAEHMEAEKSVWDNLIENVTETKNEVISLQYKLFNPEQTKFITSEEKKRKQKRDRIRRKKKVSSEKYVTSLSKRIKLNEEIDEALQKQHTKIAMEKRDESLKNVAGESLVEVKRKQSEVSEFMDVFNLLRELRDIRKKTAIYQGIFVTEKDDEKFSTQIERASKLLSSNADVYENKEHALRELREEEVQEINRVEKEKRKKRKENRQEQLSQVDPMFPFRLYWLQGEESIAGLIHVRRMWDIFVCEPGTRGGTRIPKTFVEACKPCNKEWAKYLVKQPKVRKRKSDFGTPKNFSNVTESYTSD